MDFKCLVIGGTLAPWICELPYYGKILAVPEAIGIDTEYTSIRLLGLGNIEDATDHIAGKYFDNKQGPFVLIGHSQGAIIAGLLSMRYPTKVLTVIALAGPYKEGIDQLTRGAVRLRPKLPRSRLSKLVGNVVPVVRDLSSDSDVLAILNRHLETQTTGPTTHSIIATDDRFVIPSRSAHPDGPKVRKYLAAHPNIHHHLHGRIPEEIELLAFKAGHILMVNDLGVLELLERIIAAEQP
jgi:pimeloyl-ACP methyl ester carboxylesterase